MATTAAIATEMSPLTLLEYGGSSAGKDSLVLAGRALPYRPLRVGGKQRAEFTWYPGSSAAVVQMLGPEEEPILMNGYWKDRFLGRSTSITQTVNAQALYNDEQVNTVTELVAYVDAMRRSGKRWRLSWDKLVRYGHITAFRQTWHTVHDCEWELEFTVSAQEPADTPFVKADPPTIFEAKYVFDRSTNELPPPSRLVRMTNSLRARTYAAQQAVSTVARNVTNTATQLANQITSPFQAARDLSATTAQGVRSVVTTFGTIADRAVAESFAFRGGQDQSPIGQQVAAYSYVNEWRVAGNAAANSCAYYRYQSQQQLQQDSVIAFTADRTMTLRMVSAQFYGTQDGWRDLMLFNMKQDDQVFPGELLWIPKQTGVMGDSGSSGSAGRPTGG